MRFIKRHQDMLRTVKEVGSFTAVTDGVIFHNTMDISNYVFLQHGSFEPRPVTLPFYSEIVCREIPSMTVHYSRRRTENFTVTSVEPARTAMPVWFINYLLANPRAVPLPKQTERWTTLCVSLPCSLMAGPSFSKNPSNLPNFSPKRRIPGDKTGA